MIKRIHVVAAVIVHADRQSIFISRRADHLHQGGLWEFPGGKVEAGENAESALARELFEELDIAVQAARPFMQVEHDYPDKQVLLDIWQVDSFTGTARGKEGQQCRWVGLQELHNDQLFEFPAANQPILKRLLEVGID